MSHIAILLAGRRPGIDPLAEEEGVDLKVLIDIGGRRMIARVVDALLAVPRLDRVIVLSQDVQAIEAALAPDPRLSVQRSGEGIARSVAAVAGSMDAPWPVFVTTADHPLLSPATITAFLDRSAGVDIAVGVVERRIVRARFPENRRTWLKFADGWWTGANLFALNGPSAAGALAVWSGVEADRKKGWKLVARFGPLLLLRALTRTIGLGRAVEIAGNRMGVSARAVPLADPLAAVDVDKASDLALAREVLLDEA